MDIKQKACLAIILAFGVERRRRVKRKYWVKEWLTKGVVYSHIQLLQEISITSEQEDYKNFLRMNEETFMKLLEMVEPFLQRQDTVMRNSLPVKERLILTLRYLATGRSFEDLKFSAIMSPAAISIAVIETCEVLIYALRDYIKVKLFFKC